MPPKQNYGDLKESIDSLAEDVSAVKTQQTQLLELLEEVKQLRLQNQEKSRRITELERRVDDLEQYSRINDVIISGIQIKPRSYARAVVGDDGEPGEQETRSVEQQVAADLQSRGIELDLEHIEACHPLRQNSDKSIIIMRFANRRNKTALMKQRNKLKGSKVFINEHLTKKNADIAKKARYLKKQQRIQDTWVTNCKIFVKLNGTSEGAKVLVVRSIEELDRFN